MIRLCLMLLAIPAAAPAAAQVTVALDWTPNTNHVGLYVAEAQGFYAEAGVDVAILPYSDTSSGTLVANGVAQFGVLSAVGWFTQRAAGADLQAAFAVVQHETGRLVYQDEAITTPADLDGRTYAGFGSDWEKALIGTIIRNAGGVGEFETVTLGTSAYEALANGSVDFTLEVSTWEGVNATLLGRDQGAFRYEDYGVPDQHTTFIGATSAWLDANRTEASAFLTATQRGYEWAAANPDAAAEILIDATLLANPEQVHASMKALVDGDYLLDDQGHAGRIDPAKIEAMGGFLFDAGILKDGDGNPLTTRPDFAEWTMLGW